MESLNKTNNGAAAPSEGDVAVIDELRTTYNSMKSEMAKVIVGPVSYTHLTLPTNREV